jgi:hypothetical protein
MIQKPAAKFLVILFGVLISFPAIAQEKKDLMRDNGKIYVVVAVMVTILLGLILYLARLDRKIGKLEKETGQKP